MTLHTHYDLTRLNTLGLRAEAEFFCELQSDQDLKDLFQDSNLRAKSWKILGGGSNLVLPSQIHGLTLHVANKGRELVLEDDDAWYVQAAAGEVWNEFVQWTLKQGYAGLENLSLIPGTVGAAPIQNIGAYGVEVKDTLHQVTCVDLQDGSFKTFSNKECHFSYRDSFFKQEGAGRYLVWNVTFRLPKKFHLHLEYGDIRKEVERRFSTPSPKAVAEAVIVIRQSKLPDPAVIGNAGSFFKNPIVTTDKRDDLLKEFPDLVSFPAASPDSFKLAAGWLIDRAGWKGRKLGPVGMYEKQALVLVNHGGASADDVWKLAQKVSSDIQGLFGVSLEAEPVRW